MMKDNDPLNPNLDAWLKYEAIAVPPERVNRVIAGALQAIDQPVVITGPWRMVRQVERAARPALLAASLALAIGLGASASALAHRGDAVSLSDLVAAPITSITG